MNEGFFVSKYKSTKTSTYGQFGQKKSAMSQKIDVTLDMKKNWSDYYKSLEGKSSTPTLIKALDYFDNNIDLQKKSIDIGCGNGLDIQELLKRDFEIIAFDKEREAIDILNKRFRNHIGKKLKVEISTMEEFIFPKASLINASYSIPFCHPDYFMSLWVKIEKSLPSRGVFCGQLFGKEDSWTIRNNMTFHSNNDIKNLFKNFKFLLFDEKNSIGKTSTGEEKRWHVFNIVAMKL